MAGIQTKTSYGGGDIAAVSPTNASEKVNTLKVSLTFEEALKIHLGLGQALGKLNSYNRATKAGKQSCVSLVFYLGKGRVRVVEDKTR